MGWLRRVIGGANALARSERAEREMDEELRACLEAVVEEKRLWQDVRYAGRALRKSPGFTAVAVLTLALGVGVNTAIFSVVNAVMLRPLPFGNPDRLVRIYESNPERGWPEFSASDPNFLDWRAQATSWEALAAFDSGTISLTTGDAVEVLRMMRVTSDLLPAVGLSPPLGRSFRPDETRSGLI
jgi:hypothetical protein